VQKTGTDIANEAIGRKDYNKPANDSLLEKVGIDKVDADLNWGAAVSNNPTLAQKVRGVGYRGKGEGFVDKDGNLTDDPAKRDPGAAPAWAVGIMAIAQDAQKGDESAQAKIKEIATSDSYATKRGDALYKNVAAEDLPKIKAFAQWELMRSTKNAPAQGQGQTSIPYLEALQ
jgi:hypothetical protein